MNWIPPENSRKSPSSPANGATTPAPVVTAVPPAPLSSENGDGIESPGCDEGGEEGGEERGGFCQKFPSLECAGTASGAMPGGLRIGLAGGAKLAEDGRRVEGPI